MGEKDTLPDDLADAIILDWKLRGLSKEEITLGMSILNKLMSVSIQFGPIIREQIYIEAMRSCANVLEVIKERYAEN